jgi:hypothetical protein
MPIIISHTGANMAFNTEIMSSAAFKIGVGILLDEKIIDRFF